MPALVKLLLIESTHDEADSSSMSLAQVLLPKLVELTLRSDEPALDEPRETDRLRKGGGPIEPGAVRLRLELPVERGEGEKMSTAGTARAGVGGMTIGEARSVGCGANDEGGDTERESSLKGEGESGREPETEAETERDEGERIWIALELRLVGLRRE